MKINYMPRAKTNLLVVFVMLSGLMTGQSCLPEGITFKSQEQIDDFKLNYPNCTNIEGNMVIDSDHITNFEGLNMITSVEGDMVVEVNDSILNFRGLENLTSIGGELHIWGNYGLRSLDGLDNLNSIGGSLILAYHPHLEDLSALKNLTEIGNRLTVVYNQSLQSIDGLDHIIPSTIKQLNIYSNPLLSECAIKSICEYLGTFNADIDIYFNSDQCNSVNEVGEACEHLTVDENEAEDYFILFPNPANDWLAIDIQQRTLPDAISILNEYGQVILISDGHEPIINITSINPGIYIVACRIDEQVFRKKLVIR